MPTTVVASVVPDEVVAKLDELASAQQWTRSTTIRNVLLEKFGLPVVQVRPGRPRPKVTP